MGAMIVPQPELARAIPRPLRRPLASGSTLAGRVGIYDTLREEDFPNGAFNVTEFGTMQARKMAAALQWATSGTGPILLPTTAGIGHGVDIPVDAGNCAKAATYALPLPGIGMTVPMPSR